jgi:hypothetical protein
MQVLFAHPEDEVLLCCARTCLDQDKISRIKYLVQNDIDWSYLIQTALQHGVIPLLYRSLNEACADSIPVNILNQLRNYFITNTLRNTYLNNKLFQLLQLFESHNISVIPYKGPVLATSVYGDIALRQFSDLDILVQKQDSLRAVDILASAGYKLQSKLSVGKEEDYLRSQYEVLFCHKDIRLFVELHWEIVPRYFNFPVASLRLWDHMTKDVSGLRTIQPEDMLLILCVHGAKHLWIQLLWICDVAEIVRKGLDWERVLNQANIMGIQRIVFLGLFLAKDLLNVTLPEKIINHIEADPLVKILANKVKQRLFSHNNSPGIFKSSVFHLQARERLRDRIKYCVQFTIYTNPRDWEFIKLPNSLFFLYYLIRPIRLAVKYVPLKVRSIYSKKD